MASLISAPAPALTGEVAAPGDKSISHRALMFGALAVGETAIDGLLEGDDVKRTAAAMRALGAGVERLGEGRWRVRGVGVGGFAEPADVLDMGNSGTGARLLMGLLASSPIFAVFTGDASLRRRPMARVTGPLELLGARFWSREGGRLPLAMQGARDPVPIEYRLPVASAQVKSAVLLAGLNAPGETTVVEPEPTRDHTERLLRHFGATVRVHEAEGGRRITVVGQPELKARPVSAPGDPSSAAFPVAAALLASGSELRVRNVNLNPLRAGFYETLREMGADIRIENPRELQGEPAADLLVRSGPLKSANPPPERAPSMIDEYPILAVVAAFAEGVTTLRGAAELRVKESDRIAAMARGLAALGVRVEELPDGLVVHGCGGRAPAAEGVTIETELDHRIAMSFLVYGMAARAAVRIDDAAMIDTSFPGFARLMNGLGARLTPA